MTKSTEILDELDKYENEKGEVEIQSGKQDQLTKLSEAGSLEDMYLEYGV